MAGILTMGGREVSPEDRAKLARNLAKEGREATLARRRARSPDDVERRRKEAISVPGQLDLHEIIAPGGKYEVEIGSGSSLRIVDWEGEQAVDLLCFDNANPEEMYNAANTIKINKNIYINEGCGLYSVMGNELMVVDRSTFRDHDTIGGCCSRDMNYLRYGLEGDASCKDNFVSLLEARRMPPVALPANLNFFMSVPVKVTGEAEIIEGTSQPGDFVDLRAKRDIVVLISNCPQVYNGCNGWIPSEVHVIRYRGRSD